MGPGAGFTDIIRFVWCGRPKKRLKFAGKTPPSLPSQNCFETLVFFFLSLFAEPARLKGMFKKEMQRMGVSPLSLMSFVVSYWATMLVIFPLLRST